MLLVFLAISLSQAHEFVYLKEVQKYYFDDKEMSEMQFTLDLYNVTILFISVSVLLSALYSVCYSILSNYSEISENVTKEIVRSSKFNMFGSGSATEILNNNVKQVNVNIQCESGSAIVEDSTLPHRLVNKMYQENTNTQTGAKDNIAMQKNVNTQQASSSKSPVPNNSSQTTLIINDNLDTNSSTPLSATFLNLKELFHSNISSNSVSTNGGLNTIDLTEFHNKINSLLDELKALPNHEAAVNSFTKIV